MVQEFSKVNQRLSSIEEHLSTMDDKFLILDKDLPATFRQIEHRFEEHAAIIAKHDIEMHCGHATTGSLEQRVCSIENRITNERINAEKRTVNRLRYNNDPNAVFSPLVDITTGSEIPVFPTTFTTWASG
jgi:hypothetical protein